MSLKKYCLYGTLALLWLVTGFSSAQETISDELATDTVIEEFDVESALGDVRTLKSTIDVLTEQLFALDAREKTEEGISEKYQEVRNEIVSVITTIQTTTEEIDTMMRRVAGYKKNIETTAQTVRVLRNEIDETKNVLEEFAVFLYQTNNYIADPQKWAIDEIKLLIHSDNIPRTLSNQQLIESMMKQFVELLEKLENAEKQHIEAIVKLNELRINAKRDIIVYSEELEKMQQKKLYLSQFIELYTNGSLQTNTIGGIFQSPKSVHETILSMVDSLYKKEYNVSFNIFDKIKELDGLNTNTSYPHDIAWPIYPIGSIETFFDDEDFRQENWFPHRWLQVKATQNTPIYSIRDGIVYHVTDNDSIGINWMLILHTDGYISTYTYLNRSMVQVGDVVRRGQLLGYSGGEPGTRGAWFIAPGSNLTFSVFKNGAPIDPLSLLDASVVTDKDILPDVYSIKYLRDKYIRWVDVTELAFMSGGTVDERSQNFLASYAVGIYKTLTFWDNAVVGTNIDRDMVICVAFAESTLGRYLSTNGNIGNVGNNDRWDRFAFWSALAGARAIAQTLNNQYLGDYHTINQLSRYGNPDGAIYASSPINWQTNVTKCLSQIKGYYVPEDFPFRTGVNPNKLAQEAAAAASWFDREQVKVGQGE
jgi:murein DD-endopeptidase MepM/ murein hydrolase activator NlpD